MKILRVVGKVLILLLALYGACMITAALLSQFTMRTLSANLRHAEQVTVVESPVFFFDRTPLPGRILAQASERKEIAGFMGTLRIQPSLMQLFGAECMCGGDLGVIVERAGEKPFEFTIHHGHALRLPGTITGDAVLKPDGAYDLAVWLSRHGAFGKERDVQPGVPGEPSQSSGR